MNVNILKLIGQHDLLKHDTRIHNNHFETNRDAGPVGSTSI